MIAGGRGNVVETGLRGGVGRVGEVVGSTTGGGRGGRRDVGGVGRGGEGMEGEEAMTCSVGECVDLCGVGGVSCGGGWGGVSVAASVSVYG